MSGTRNLRLWRQLYLLPVLLWAVTGALLFASGTNLLREPMHRQAREDLLFDARRLEAILGQSAPEAGAAWVEALFSAALREERLVLSDATGRVLADSGRDSTLWLTRPGEALAGSAGWRISQTELPGDRDDGRIGIRLDGSGPAGGLSLQWSRNLPAIPSSGSRLGTGFVFYWIVLGLLLFLSGWNSSSRIQRWVRTLRTRIQTIDSEPAAGGPSGPIADGGTGRDPLDLDYDLERVRQRIERELTESRLESRQREAIFEGMAEGLVAIDASLRILLMNRAASEMLSVPQPVPLGTRLSECVRVSALHRYVEDLQGLRQPPPLELELDGGRRVSMVHGTRLQAADGRFKGMVLVFTDVTDVRQLERVRKDFVDNVSHELKTPLTTIRGYVETLLDGAHQEQKTRLSFLRTIQGNVERMHRIVEDLLNLSRIESQGRQIERQMLVPSDLVARTVEEMRPEAERRRIRLVAHLEGAQAPFLGNSFMLERALANLIDNAFKYGGQAKQVEVRCLRLGDRLLLQVTDHGPGISAGHQNRLFERFYRVDRGRSRELGGTGLGLAIVKHVALAHGGEALVDSSPGEGATFTIKLPWISP